MQVFSEALRERRRNWRVSLGFSLVVGIALALVVVCLSLAWPVLWQPLPFDAASRLVAIHSSRKGSDGGLAWADATDLRARIPAIRALAVYGARTWGIQTDRKGHVDVMLSAMVTGEFFDVLGARPALGEPITRAHDEAGAQQVTWLSSTSATRLFGSADAALHRTLWISDVPYRVAGVLPASFRFPMSEGEPDLLIPLSRADYCCARGGSPLQAIARLDDNREFDARLDAASHALATDYPATNAGLRFTAVDFREHLFGPRLRAVRWILAAAFCLLLVALSNSAGIWLARWLALRRDAAIRLALGASHSRMAAVRAVEGAIAGTLSAAVGIALAWTALAALRTLPGVSDKLAAFSVWRPLAIAPPAIFAALAIGIFAGIATALLPHLVLWYRLSRTGARDGLSASPVAWRVRLALTAVQLAATAVLGWTSIAIGENVYSLLNAPRGFTADQTLVAGIGVPEARYDSDEKMTGFHRSVIEQLRAVPGVVSAAGGASFPQGAMRTRFLRDGQALDRQSQPIAQVAIVTPELLPLLGVPVRRGRGLQQTDRWDAPRVALVNEAFVRRYLAGADPLREGLRPAFYNGFAMRPYTRVQIVGVIADTRNHPTLLSTQPQILLPAGQVAMEGFSYFVKTTRPVSAIQSDLREAVWRVDPAIERVRFRSLADDLERGLADRRALGVFGWIVLGAAVIIVGVGLFATLAASLLESARELAIRSAIGATPARLALELTRGVAMAAACAALTAALVVPWLAARIRFENAVLAPTLMNVTACAGGMLLVIAVSVLAPVRKAARTQPADVLRTR